jgi:hypothetical protein
MLVVHRSSHVGALSAWLVCTEPSARVVTMALSMIIVVLQHGWCDGRSGLRPRRSAQSEVFQQFGVVSLVPA